jgi:phosphoenolpyruvate---glycerone phosphotransferase subunit DhaL
MPGDMTVESIRWAVGRLAAGWGQAADELNALDGAIGDGDLGVTVTRAAKGLADDLPNLPGDFGLALLRCAQTVNRVSAGTYGTLLATGLMAAAKATKGRAAVPWPELGSILAGAVKAMSDRGGGQLGDKTVLDAVDAARQGVEGLEDPSAMAPAAVAAIAAAVERIRALPFRQGRARIFGEKGLGLDDPGMIAFQRLVERLR